MCVRAFVCLCVEAGVIVFMSGSFGLFKDA